MDSIEFSGTVFTNDLEFKAEIEYFDLMKRLQRFKFDYDLVDESVGITYDVNGYSIMSKVFAILEVLELDILDNPILVTNTPADSPEAVAGEDYAKCGICFTLQGCEPKIHMISGTLRVFKGTTKDEVDHELDNTDWTRVQYWFYRDYTQNPELETYIQTWVRDKGTQALALRRTRIRYIPQEILDAYGAERITNIRDLDIVNEMMDASSSRAASWYNLKVRLFDKLQTLQTDYFYFGDLDMSTVCSDAIIDVLAMLYIQYGKRTISLPATNIMQKWVNAICRMSSLKCLPMYMRLTRDMDIVRAYGSALLKHTHPYAFIHYKGIPYLGSVQNIKNNTKILFLNLKDINMLLGQPVQEADSPIHVRYYPKYTYLHRGVTLHNTTHVELQKKSTQYVLSDLHTLSDSELRIFDGRANDFYFTSGCELQIYAKWDAVCRLFEQIIRKDPTWRKLVETTTGGYVTIRDFVVITDKETGEVYLGYVHHDVMYDVCITDFDRCYHVSVPELEYADVLTVVDTDSTTQRYKHDVMELHSVMVANPELGINLQSPKLPLNKLNAVNYGDFFVYGMLYSTCIMAGTNTPNRDMLSQKLDLFQSEMVDPFNYRFIKKHKDLAIKFTPGTSSQEASLINIFGGLNMYTGEISNYKAFSPGPLRSRKNIPITVNHFRKNEL